MKKGTTLTRFVMAQQRMHPGSTGDFTGLLTDIATVAKIIAREVNRAGLTDLLDYQGAKNIHGEQVRKLDVFANETFISILSDTGHLIGMASEEMPDVYHVPESCARGNYIFMMDPLDGSSNADANISIGSIFSIYKRKSKGPTAILSDFLRQGLEQVCAGYVIYGQTTILVYSTGNGVHGFSLDPSIGEFLLLHENIRIPEKGNIYSINESNAPTWNESVRHYIDRAKKEGMTARYTGSLVSDFHRNLVKGGIFLYPADKKNQRGKLRLLYEASPLAFIVHAAGGMATTGEQMILEIWPESLHQRVPLVIGSPNDVRTAMLIIAHRT